MKKCKNCKNWAECYIPPQVIYHRCGLDWQIVPGSFKCDKFEYINKIDKNETNVQTLEGNHQGDLHD